jgi:hypothetical protein
MDGLKISINDFQSSKKGTFFVKECIRSSMASLYEDGTYTFPFSVSDENIIFHTQPVDQARDEYSVCVDVDMSVFAFCENVEEFEIYPEHKEDFEEICLRLYWKALKEIEE